MTQTDEKRAWEQLMARDATAEFFYGVVTTGVFCRPECKSRRPLRANVRFFATLGEARLSGLRACKRCKPEEPRTGEAVVRMCALLERRVHRPVRLAELGRLAGISPFTAQRLFKQKMGVTPAQYQRAMRGHALRSELREGGMSVTTAIYEAGYGSSSRAYEQQPLGMTPGRFVAGGKGERIRFAVAEAPLGWLIVGATERGICWLAIGDSAEDAESSIRKEFPAAEISADAELKKTVKAVIARLGNNAAPDALPLDLRGTAFQLKVWKALQAIPAGVTKTYSQLAAEMGMPAATRAVARACATNRVSVLVPCHRVIGVSGSLTGYRWGVERKRALLNAESLGH